MKNMKNWNKINDNKVIEKEFVFENFQEALDFINSVGKLAESADHHPDILLFAYKKVRITLTTHSENKVTEKDFNLAKKIDKLI